MRKKQMLALFMSLSLLAQGMLFGGCGQKSIGEQPAQTRMETEESGYGDNRFPKTGSDGCR